VSPVSSPSWSDRQRALAQRRRKCLASSNVDKSTGKYFNHFYSHDEQEEIY
jgi:hypothetical protein